MVKILAFPGTRSAPAEGLRSSTAVAPPVISLADGSFIISGLEEADTQRGLGDWTNQELADLYRVESLLIQANIRISTGRGMTDEGDPWFVFCKEDGDVFVHLARIGETYLLDSPGLGEILEGHDFPELIGRFVRQIAARAAPDNNVVSLRPRMLHDQTIRLHPAVMLAALVWALYLASDDFVGVAHAMEEIDDRSSGSGGHFQHLMLTEALNGKVEPEAALRQLSEQTDVKSPVSSSLAADRPALPTAGDSVRTSADLMRAGAVSPAGMHQTVQSVAASLAVIAVSYGFHQIQEADVPSPRDIVSLESSGLASEHAKVTVPQAPEKTEQLSLLADGSGAAPKAVEDTHKDSSYEIKMERAEASLDVLIKSAASESHAASVILTSEIQIEIQKISGTAHQDGQTAQAAAGPQVASASSGTATANSGSATVSSGTSDTMPTQKSESTTSETSSVLKLISQYLGTVSDYKVGNVTVSTTTDVSSIDKVLAHLNTASDAKGDTKAPTGTIAITSDSTHTEKAPTGSAGGTQPATPVPATALIPHYDSKAQDFVNHFIQGTGSIEMMQFNSEIVLVDMNAINGIGGNAYMKSWVTDDGHVISTIGHLQDFVSYGLA